MAHISELALFRHLAKEADLSTEQLSHLEKCGDCAERAVEFRRVIRLYGDLSKAKRFLVEEEELAAPEPFEDEEDRDLHKRAG
jgi:hypothetical protein